MLNLDDYGYLLEEYDYSFDEDDHVKEIAYSRYNEKGKEVKAVGVCKGPNGEYLRSIVRWPQNNDDISEPDGVVNDKISHMSLKLETTGKKRSKPGDIVVMRYENSPKRDEGEGAEFFYPVTTGNVDIAILKDNILVYDKNLHIGKEYYVPNDEDITDDNLIEITKDGRFGMVSISTKGNYITVVFQDGSFYEYYTDKTENEIESLRYRIGSIALHGEKYDFNYKYDNLECSYYDNDMVSKVAISYDDYMELPDELYSRSEVIEMNGSKTTISIYPAMITENLDNYRFKLFKLWACDTMIEENGIRVSFERKLYVIRNSRKLLKELRSDLDTLKLL